MQLISLILIRWIVINPVDGAITAKIKKQSWVKLLPCVEPGLQ